MEALDIVAEEELDIVAVGVDIAAGEVGIAVEEVDIAVEEVGIAVGEIGIVERSGTAVERKGGTAGLGRFAERQTDGQSDSELNWWWKTADIVVKSAVVAKREGWEWRQETALGPTL